MLGGQWFRFRVDLDSYLPQIIFDGTLVPISNMVGNNLGIQIDSTVCWDFRLETIRLKMFASGGLHYEDYVIFFQLPIKLNLPKSWLINS